MGWDGTGGLERLVIGNWKMNLGLTASDQWCDEFLASPHLPVPGLQLGIAPPVTVLARLAERLKNWVAVGAQDCSGMAAAGAYTGEVSAELLADAGAVFALIGHSERRRGLAGESNGLVASKYAAAVRAGLLPVLCLGESLAERDSGETSAVLARQIRDSIALAPPNQPLVLAYEPVWAIGARRAATPEQIVAAHLAIREQLPGHPVRILYGGSVTANNAKSLVQIAGVDGLLVGGASLKASDFVMIAREVAGSVGRQPLRNC
ncbi:MAG: triose-phosphate isomerase [Alphaproteobacteria bacterium]|nr:triose-phosphate isomerase [Alphaproteobacteria bacterium]